MYALLILYIGKHICILYYKGGAYYGCLPVPSSQKVLLHVQADPSHRMASKQLSMVNGQQEEATQRRHNRKPFRSQKTGSIAWNSKLNSVTQRELSQAENKRISDIIDRQRCCKPLATTITKCIVI